jgi:hypothetical protein
MVQAVVCWSAFASPDSRSPREQSGGITAVRAIATVSWGDWLPADARATGAVPRSGMVTFCALQRTEASQ